MSINKAPRVRAARKSVGLSKFVPVFKVILFPASMVSAVAPETYSETAAF
jgi:hypothetical protein